jgi:hypothetical protein
MRQRKKVNGTWEVLNTGRQPIALLGVLGERAPAVLPPSGIILIGHISAAMNKTIRWYNDFLYDLHAKREQQRI